MYKMNVSCKMSIHLYLQLEVQVVSPPPLCSAASHTSDGAIRSAAELSVGTSPCWSLQLTPRFSSVQLGYFPSEPQPETLHTASSGSSLSASFCLDPVDWSAYRNHWVEFPSKPLQPTSRCLPTCFSSCHRQLTVLLPLEDFFHTVITGPQNNVCLQQYQRCLAAGQIVLQQFSSEW